MDRLFAAGPAALDDQEIVALLLGRGGGGSALGAASRVLDRVGGLAGLGRAGPAALAEVPGIGRTRAARLAAGAELGRRLVVRAAAARPRLATPAAVAAYLTPQLGWLDVEQMWVLSLDGRSRLQGVRCVARGGRHGCGVAVRDILCCVLADAGSGFILAHNHPSGEPAPSAEDVAMTRAVARAAEVVGTPLVDHVIVTAAGRYSSLCDAGLL